MSTILTEDQEFQIPSWVTDLASFRRWSDQEDFPDTGRVWFIRGEVWLDISPEQLFTHVQVKDELTCVLRALVDREELGFYFSNDLFLTKCARGHIRQSRQHFRFEGKLGDR